MSFTVYRKDNFNRSNRSLDGDTNGDIVWQVGGASGTFSILNGKGSGTATPNTIMYDSSMPIGRNQWASIRVYPSSGTTSTTSGPAVRCSSGAGGINGYCMYLNDGGVTAGVYCLKIVNGSPSLIGFSDGTVIEDDGMALIKAVGDTIETWVYSFSYPTGKLVHRISDSSISSGQCGFWVGGGTAVFDDWTSYINFSRKIAP